MNDGICLYGGSFSPPTGRDETIVRALRSRFKRVFVIPCGTRPDKWSTNVVDPMHRARMSTIAFAPLGVDLDLSDLESDVFTPLFPLDERYRRTFPSQEIWHAVSSEHVRGGATGASNIQREWEQGAYVWKAIRFVVVLDPKFPLEPGDLPPHAVTLEVGTYAAQPDGLAAYTRRFGLYHGGTGQQREGLLTLPANPRLCVLWNHRKPEAVEMAAGIMGERVRHPKDADVVIAVGGDGHMLDVIKRTPMSVPIIGLNAGTTGFLLNNLAVADLNRMIAEGATFDTHLFPMLDVEVDHLDASRTTSRAYGFNDAWVERSGTQTAWVRVEVQWPRFYRRIERLMCDEVLVANPAGSTAYANNMGSPAIPPQSRALVLAAGGSKWGGAMLPEDAVVTFTALDSKKRPIRAMVDGKKLGPCQQMRIRRSRARSTELAFVPGRSIIEKIAEMQFPA